MPNAIVDLRPRRWLSDSFARGPATRAVTRRRLLDLSVGLVEDVRRSDAGVAPGPDAFSPAFQVCLPYRGIFIWHVGHDDIVGDGNQVVYITGGESCRISSPLADGYAELIVTPNPAVLADLMHLDRAQLRGHPIFRQRRRRADSRLQALRARFLSWVDATNWDDLQAEETVLALLRATLSDPAPCADSCGPSTRRLVGRMKEFLAAELANPISLLDVGQAVGASPAYLTDAFRRAEGISLHRYLIQLRLARALVELPEADDLTTLALDLGFSSHSHFSAAFRRAFDLTPSQFRESSRRGSSPLPLATSALAGSPDNADDR